MALVSRSVVLAGFAALGVLVSSACASGDDESSARADSAPATVDSTPPMSGPPHVAGTPSGATAVAPAGVSVTTGVYSVAQAARGSEVYVTSCGQCHTMGQHSGTAFATAWNNRRLYDLYEIVRNTMPLDNPGGLNEQDYIDVVAYMLALNGVPAGKAALRADASALKELRIDVKPSAGP
jgi:mono/diheme cytochrome c family protein